MAGRHLLSWGGAYTDEPCYMALRRYDDYRHICDVRLGITFVFAKDSFTNGLAVVGWSVPYALATWSIAELLLRGRRWLMATAFTTLSGVALWFLLAVSLNGYGCAFGFGGFDCAGWMEELGLQALFMGWTLPVLALVGTAWVAVLRRRRGDS